MLLGHPTALAKGAVSVAAAVLLAGCASDFVNIAPRPPEKYEQLGPATGTACGALLIDGTAFNLIPIALNSRSERAYANAVASVPGATALIDVTVQESWAWWLIGSSRCTTVKGVAIK
jgi:hypothetical protein